MLRGKHALLLYYGIKNILQKNICILYRSLYMFRDAGRWIGRNFVRGAIGLQRGIQQASRNLREGRGYLQPWLSTLRDTYYLDNIMNRREFVPRSGPISQSYLTKKKFIKNKFRKRRYRRFRRF